MSACCSADATCSTLIFRVLNRSRTEWKRTSMCLLLAELRGFSISALLSCEVDPVAHICLDVDPNTTYAQTATLSAFTDSVLDNYATEVLSSHTNRVGAPFLPGQGLDLISGAVIVDDATFTTFLSLTRGASAMSWFDFRALLDTGSSQSFVHKRASTEL